MTDQRRPSTLFGIVTLPAWALSRVRVGLRISLAEDAATFSGRALAVFAVLALVAVAYPIVASLVHASIGTGALPRMEPINAAVLPYFEDVYAESLPFMIAVAGIGTFSPSLGVLLIAVFIPADLFAASKDTSSLQSLQAWGWIPAALIARLISYGLLWILAVEIPLLVRRWATSMKYRDGREPSEPIRVAATIAGTAVLVLLWARALPWLIKPVFEWTPKQFTVAASNPTWTFWPILVIAVTLIAAVASVWPRPVRLSPAEAASAAPPGPPRGLAWTAARHLVAVVILTFLFAGLVTSALSAVILVGGLLIAGPLLTLVLPRLPVPRAVRQLPGRARWVAGLIAGALLAGALVGLVDVAEEQQLTLFVVALVAGTNVMRVVADGGAPIGPSPDALAVPTVPPGPVIAASLVFMLGVAWLLMPTVALADNCVGEGEVGECAEAAAGAGFFMLAGGILAAGFLMGMGRGPGEDPGKPKFKGQKTDRPPRDAPKLNEFPTSPTPPDPPPPPPPPEKPHGIVGGIHSDGMPKR